MRLRRDSHARGEAWAKKESIDSVVGVGPRVVGDARAVKYADERTHENVAGPMLREVQARVAWRGGKRVSQWRDVPGRGRRAPMRLDDDDRRRGEGR